MKLSRFQLRRYAGVAFAASLASVISLSSAMAAPPADDAEAQAREAWREAIVNTPAPDEACFHAAYPNTAWEKVECTDAPNRPYVPRSSTGPHTVGDGNDYAAEVPGIIKRSVGSFPTVTGVTSEKDGTANTYSLQLNSNFMNTAVCEGITNCQSWEQFVYSSGERSAFMQYWLINYGKCPSGWFTYSPDCYKNSRAVSVPKEIITELANLKIAASATANGIDTLVFTTDTDAYTTSGKDSVVFLATGWQGSEFNVIGDGGGGQANFNSGSSITVKITVASGSTAAPTCAADAGTTGETNNLTLGACTAKGGAVPSVEFIESN